MFGLFLVNREKKVAFAQFGSHVKIESFRYVRDARLCLVKHSEGVEEMFTSEQPPEIAERLGAITEILVAHLDDEGRTVEEYAVPVEHAG